jgi:putative membrane protein insertion efficiency factor
MSRAVRAAVFAVRGYQRLLSPLLPPSCRFAPTCSEYAAQAILEHGIMRGVGLAMSRLARCHPFHAGGYDPPPHRRRRE